MTSKPLCVFLFRHGRCISALIIAIFIGGVWLSFPSNNDGENTQIRKGAISAGDDNRERIRHGFVGQPGRVEGDAPFRKDVNEDALHLLLQGMDQQQPHDDNQQLDKNTAHNLKGPHRYTAQWSSLDTRPLPDWYQDAKFGIFIHWGVFSVPSFYSEWFWHKWRESKPTEEVNQEKILEFMKRNYKPNASYVNFAPEFTAQFFNPSQWAQILGASGARYVVLTSKHHEGYTMWPSKFSSRWNAVDVGPRRDLLGELTKAVRTETKMRMGFYYSLYEWFHPLYLQDKANGFITQDYINMVMMPELRELVEGYQPDIVWGDGEWEAPSDYWKSQEFLAWLFNDSPVKDYVVTNDRWGSDARCKHGSFLTCDDRFDPGKVMPKKWENCSTIDRKSWGFVRHAQLDQYLSAHDIISILVRTVSYNGNLLLNIGPTHDGLITPIYEQRLREVGEWLRVNGDAIYGTSPWRRPQDTLNQNVRYTMKKDAEGHTVVYAVFLEWPKSNILDIGAPRFTDQTQVSMLGVPQLSLSWIRGGSEGVQGETGIIHISLPTLNPLQLPCHWTWVLQLSHVT